MKVLLIDYPYTSKVYSFTSILTRVEPRLGLCYLASYLNERGHCAKILDANALNLSDEEILERISFLKPKMIGFSAVTTEISGIYSFSKKVKQRFPKVMIVVGGPHVTFTAKRTFEEAPEMDFIVIGEGEKTLFELCEALEREKSLKDIKGLAFRQENSIGINESREFVDNLDSLPFPLTDGLPLDLYKECLLDDFREKGRFFTVMSARGCPYNCVFCSAPKMWRRQYRLRSMKNFVDEMEQLYRKDVKKFRILDDTFTSSEKRVLEFCREIEKRKMKISFSCFGRVNVVNERMLKALKQAGCKSINYGVESGSSEILKRVRKNITLERAKEVIALSKKLGLTTFASFMIGLPGDTNETIRRTIDFAKECNPSFAEFYITTPFVGTEIYYEWKEKGWIDERDWNKFSLRRSSVVNREGLGSEEIIEWRIKAYREFVLRPRWLLETAIRFSHPSKWVAAIAAMYAFFTSFFTSKGEYFVHTGSD